MPHLLRKQVFVLLTLAVCCLAVTLWLGLRYYDALENSSRTRACEEWERAEASGQSLGWDLTYKSALKRMGLCPGSPFCDEWAKPEPPIHKHFAEWQGDPITSSMEIELPDGHAGMAIMRLIRTKDNAYYWSYHTSNLDNTGMKSPLRLNITTALSGRWHAGGRASRQTEYSGLTGTSGSSACIKRAGRGRCC